MASDPRRVDHILSTTFGTFRMRVISLNRVVGSIGDEVGDAAHNSDSGFWSYRDSLYLGSVWFNIGADGEVTSHDISIVRRWQSKAAPRTTAAAMVAAMADAIRAYLADRPSLLIEAERARLHDKLTYLLVDEAKARETLSRIEDEVTDVRAELRQLAADSLCERCHEEAVSDEDSGLCATCTDYNAGRVAL
jgi:hypothetical protein